MTNQVIILLESVKLMEEGKLQGSGRFTEIETPEGVKRFEEPETIHTYAKWKALGYQVRKGEKSEIKTKSACGSIAEVSTRRMKKETKQ